MTIGNVTKKSLLRATMIGLGIVFISLHPIMEFWPSGGVWLPRCGLRWSCWRGWRHGDPAGRRSIDNTTV